MVADEQDQRATAKMLSALEAPDEAHSSSSSVSNASEGGFLPRHPAAAALAICVLLSVPLLSLVVSFAYFFQILTVLIVTAYWLVVMLGVAIRYRVQPPRARAHKRLLGVYVVLCVALLVMMGVGIALPAIRTSRGQELVVLGGLTSGSVKVSVFAEGEREFLVETRTAGGDTAWVLSPGSDNATSTSEAFRVAGLAPATEYEYRVVFPRGAGLAAEPGPGGRFRTLPRPGTGKVTFASSSCHMTNRILGGAPLKAYSRISQAAPALDFFFMLGDFIYADVPYGLGHGGTPAYGTDAGLYGNDYRTTLADAHARRFYANTPSFFQFDDHEILNDYDGGITPRYDTAIAAWGRYLGNVNPSRMQSATRSLHYAFDAGSAGFFFTDTRTMRDLSRGVLIGEQQLGDIQAWLAAKQAEPTQGFKVLVSAPGWSRNDPDPTANWRCRCPDCGAMTEDNKASCPNELDRLMDFIIDNNITGVMLLSGDTHKPGVFEIAPGIYDFSASPMHGLSDDVYPPGPDRVLFDRAGLSEVFSVVEIDAASATIKIFGGGPGITAIRVVLITLYLGAAWIVAVAILRAEPDAAPKIMRDNKIVVAVAAPLLLALVVGSVLLLPPIVDRAFHEPIFQKTLTL